MILVQEQLLEHMKMVYELQLQSGYDDIVQKTPTSGRKTWNFDVGKVLNFKIFIIGFNNNKKKKKPTTLMSDDWIISFQVRLSRNFNVWICPITLKTLTNLHEKPQAFTRQFLLEFFTENELAGYSAHGRGKKPGIPYEVFGAVKGKMNIKI